MKSKPSGGSSTVTHKVVFATDSQPPARMASTPPVKTAPKPNGGIKLSTKPKK